MSETSVGHHPGLSKWSLWLLSSLTSRRVGAGGSRRDRLWSSRCRRQHPGHRNSHHCPSRQVCHQCHKGCRPARLRGLGPTHLGGRRTRRGRRPLLCRACPAHPRMRPGGSQMSTIVPRALLIARRTMPPPPFDPRMTPVHVSRSQLPPFATSKPPTPLVIALPPHSSARSSPSVIRVMLLWPVLSAIGRMALSMQEL
jgi:hypothetical protein